MLWTVVLEKTLESPLDCKEIQPVHSKGNQSWIFLGRADAEAEAPILWPPDVKNWFIWKDPDAGEDWGQREKEATEDEMVGWHPWLMSIDWFEHEQTLGNSEGQASLVCCSPWGHEESDRTEGLNNNVWHRFLLGSCCKAERAQLSSLWWPGWVGQGWVEGEVQEGGGYMYTYGWFTSLYSRN